MTRYSGPESIGESPYKGKFVRAKDIVVFGPNLLTQPEGAEEVYHADIARGDGILSLVYSLKDTYPDRMDAGYLQYEIGKPLNVYGESIGFRKSLTINGRIGTERVLANLSPDLPIIVKDKDGKEIRSSRKER